ncbi:MAG: permease, partial [Kiritimatiellaceae bacterium]|nr:permease [Kiritimatiellaceae bacterium]
STPQTGVDSLMITYALLGWVFAIFRAVVAFLSGITCGMAVSAVSPREASESADCEDECCQPTQDGMLKRMLTYGFLTLPRNISRAVVVGIILSGILSGLIPDHYFADRLGDSPLAMLAMLVIGIPLYVCSSASVPIALAFIKAGISPGAALVFLITGPATNAATLTTLWQIIGKKQLVVFLSVLSGCALLAGILMNYFAPTLGLIDQMCHNEAEIKLIDVVSAVFLILILLKGMYQEQAGSSPQKSTRPDGL